jgi:large subunit ribosomal protein L25
MNLQKHHKMNFFIPRFLIIKNGDNEEKVVLKELQKDPAKGKFLHADFLRVSSKTNLKVDYPFNT